MPRFDTSPIVYWLFVFGLCWGLLWLVMRSAVRGRSFVGLALGLLFLLRLPSIVFNYEINPDESQMITQAMTLRHDPVYFRSVDGTTGGPLDSYFLILPTLVGLPFDYITAHLAAYGLLALSLCLLFLTARRWYGELAAQLALLPLVMVLGLTQLGDFLHYSSELVAVALLSGSTYLYATVLAQPKPSVRRVALIGLLLGMVPFGKLQAVPMAAVVALYVGLAVLINRAMSVRDRLVRLVSLGLAGLAFPLLFVGLMWINGVYADFETFYVVGNLRYASNTNQWESLLNLPAFFRNSGSFDWFITLALCIGLIGIIITLVRWSRPEPRHWLQLGFVGLLFVATLFAITRTGSGYLHYLFFLIIPLVPLLAYGWQQVSCSHPYGRYVGILAGVVFLGLFSIQTLIDFGHNRPTNAYPSDRQGGWAIQQSPVSREIKKYARPGEKLVVWGWRCDYYVQAQMPQGVAENHTIRSTFGHPMRPLYQARYVRDFVRSTPPVFVDAVGQRNLWMTDRATQGHEIIKPLGQFVASHYQLVSTVDDSRIYVRNDRVGPAGGRAGAASLSGSPRRY